MENAAVDNNSSQLKGQALYFARHDTMKVEMLTKGFKARRCASAMSPSVIAIGIRSQK